jgi:Protein of unknown function (DUF3105)
VAKKSRTPPPPRPVQAPRPRGQASASDQRAKYVLFGIAGLGIVGLVVAISLVAFGGSGSGSEQNAIDKLKAAGCTFRTVKSPPHAGDHSDVPTPTTKVKYNTDPPSNGAHYGQWATWDFYDEPVQPQMVVHNEEHGGMIMWWGDKVPAETVAKMRELYNSDPNGMLGTPYPKLGNKIAFTAWTGNPATYFKNGDYGQGRIAICPNFDEGAAKAFRDAFRGKGPEGIPLEQNTPGS